MAPALPRFVVGSFEGSDGIQGSLHPMPDRVRGIGVGNNIAFLVAMFYGSQIGQCARFILVSRSYACLLVPHVGNKHLKWKEKKSTRIGNMERVVWILG